ncbi:uncharacterized protein TNCV_2752671 [Trichonephila clavipes]|nr:uncharacterized protein TNCV_2752671 [Trichonephila clavipes]
MNLIAVQKNDYYREMHKRISGITDLQALQAKYHADCYNLIKNSIHLSNVDKKVAPRSMMIDTAMEQIYTHIEENDDFQFTMQELRNAITTEYIPDEKTIRKRLIDRYHDDIVTSCKFGSNNIICFKKINHNILTENWYNQKHKCKEEEELHIPKAASEIIRRDIRAQVYDNENYTPSDKMLENIDDSIPKSLNFLLSEIILKDKENRIETMFLRFCASYKEATLYEASATFATPPEIIPGSFAQFVHDNADFNINTMKCHDLHKSAEVFKNANEARIIYFKWV